MTVKGTRRSLGSRARIGIPVLLAASALALAGCSSSEPEATTSSLAATTAATSSAAASSPGASAAPTGAAAEACAAYFELDLLNSSYAGGAVADGDMTEQQVRDEFTAQLKTLVTQAKAAVADGTADQKMVANSQRMKKIVKSLNKQQALSDLSKKQQLSFAKSSLRVQKSCERAGFPLPDDNVTARTAAGI
jgi:hypothetical protein